MLRSFLFVMLVLMGRLAVADPDPQMCNRSFKVQYALELALNKRCRDITLEELRGLRSLELPSTNGRVRASDFVGLENLERLVAHQVTNRSLEGVLDGLGNLRELRMDFIGQVVVFSKSRIDIFPKQTKLEVLELRNLIIGREEATAPENFSLYPETMKSLTNLRRLTLRDSNVMYLSFHLFENLAKLEFVDLTNNRLDFFVGGILAEAKNLHTLNLSGNSLSRVSRLQFPGTVASVRVLVCNVAAETVARLRNQALPATGVEFETMNCP